MKYDAIVVAGGVGKRAGLGYNKVFFVMPEGCTVLEKACSCFLKDSDCQKLIVVCNEQLPFTATKLQLVAGGQERYDSVCNGLKACTAEYVLIHDAARPFLKEEDLAKLKAALRDNEGALLAMKAIDTIKQVKDGYVEKTLDRNYLYQAATPQGFKRECLIACYKQADLQGITDDASVLEQAGYRVKVVECDRSNIKLTCNEDFTALCR